MEMEHLFDLQNFNLFIFNLYLDVGSEGAQTKFGTIGLLCIILGEVLNACADRLPHT